MKITLGKLRNLINEAHPLDPELAALPQQVRIQHKTQDGSVKVWLGDRDAVNTRLTVLAAPRPVRLAILKGQKYIPDEIANELRKAGAIQPVGGSASSEPRAPKPASPAGAAPAAAGGGRMTAERANEWLQYFIRRFVRETLKNGSAPADAAVAADIADGFLGFEPRAARLISVMGLSPDDLVSMVADKLMDGVQASAEKASKAAAIASTPKASKDLYKIYPGGKKWGAPVVTRVKGKVFKGPSDSQFKPGEQANVAADGERLRVKKTDSDHAQTWEPE